MNRILELLVRWLCRDRAEFRPDPEKKTKMRQEIAERLERRKGSGRGDPAEEPDPFPPHETVRSQKE